MSDMKPQRTESDVEKINAEISERKLVKRPVLIEAVQEARAQGDLSENFEYYAAKKAKNENESRIRYLERMLRNCTVISDSSKEDEVGLNNTVVLYIEEDDEAFLNSYEIFVSSITRRIVTSTGIDVTERYPVSLFETVVNAKNRDQEIEFYNLYDSGICLKEDIKRNVASTMKHGRNRLNAAKTPSLEKYDVVFSSDDACRIYEFFKDALDIAYICMKYSPLEKGKAIAEGIVGDKITMKAVRNLPGSSQNRVVDSEGSPIFDEVLMEDNVPKAFHGSTRFSYYMGEKNTFILSNYEVSGGTHTNEELLKGPVLECVYFSDFQVDTLTGDIFGEIRLAYLHEADGSIKPVTGGSVSGNLRKLMVDMKMSEERTRYDNALIPTLTRLSGVTVTGAE